MKKLKLSENELNKAQKFINKHKSCAETPNNTGEISYIVTPSEEGISTEIRCNICKEINNITEYK